MKLVSNFFHKIEISLHNKYCNKMQCSQIHKYAHTINKPELITSQTNIIIHILTKINYNIYCRKHIDATS